MATGFGGERVAKDTRVERGWNFFVSAQEVASHRPEPIRCEVREASTYIIIIRVAEERGLDRSVLLRYDRPFANSQGS